MLLKYCTQYCGTFRKLSSGHRTRKGHFSLQYQRNTKEWTNYHTVEHFSHASQVMLKILQAGLKQYIDWELPGVQDGFRKGRGTGGQIANICWIIEKAREFQKNIYFCFIGYTQTGKLLKRWEYQTTWPASWETCMQDKKQKFQPVMEQLTGSKLGKEYIKAVYCHPAYFTYMQNTSCEMLAGWSSSWNQDCWEKYQ